MNQFFCGRSVEDRGTLYSIKNQFRHKSVTKNVYDEHVNNVVDLMTFTAEALLALLAVHVFDVDLDGEWHTNYDDDAPKAIDNIAHELVQKMWPTIDRTALLEIPTAEAMYVTEDDCLQRWYHIIYYVY